MVSISSIYNGVLNYCISNRQLKLDIQRKEKKVQGNPQAQLDLATRFLKKARHASERERQLRGRESIKALEEWDLYSQAANRLVGIVMGMAIYDSLQDNQYK